MKTDRITIANGLASLTALSLLLALAAAPALTGCSEVSNNPHPFGSEKTNTLFVPFRERSPKYLDPTSSYSNDETPFTYQVYEPLYGYHYLKRPYELIGRTAEEVARRASGTRRIPRSRAMPPATTSITRSSARTSPTSTR